MDTTKSKKRTRSVDGGSEDGSGGGGGDHEAGASSHHAHHSDAESDCSHCNGFTDAQVDAAEKCLLQEIKKRKLNTGHA